MGLLRFASGVRLRSPAFSKPRKVFGFEVDLWLAMLPLMRVVRKSERVCTALRGGYKKTERAQANSAEALL